MKMLYQTTAGQNVIYKNMITEVASWENPGFIKGVRKVSIACLYILKSHVRNCMYWIQIWTTMATFYSLQSLKSAIIRL